MYLADLVGLGMTREMGALMVGIIMAGRTGASYAAADWHYECKQRDRCLKNDGI